jgi:NCAIR mutase (PurE)-related protein
MLTPKSCSSGLHNFERTYFQSITAEKNWRTGRMEVVHYQCNLPTQLMEQVQASVNNYGKTMQASVDDYRRSIDTFVRYRELLLNYTPGGIATCFQTPRQIVV